MIEWEINRVRDIAPRFTAKILNSIANAILCARSVLFNATNATLAHRRVSSFQSNWKRIFKIDVKCFDCCHRRCARNRCIQEVVWMADERERESERRSDRSEQGSGGALEERDVERWLEVPKRIWLIYCVSFGCIQLVQDCSYHSIWFECQLSSTTFILHQANCIASMHHFFSHEFGFVRSFSIILKRFSFSHSSTHFVLVLNPPLLFLRQLLLFFSSETVLQFALVCCKWLSTQLLYSSRCLHSLMHSTHLCCFSFIIIFPFHWAIEKLISKIAWCWCGIKYHRIVIVVVDYELRIYEFYGNNKKIYC